MLHDASYTSPWDTRIWAEGNPRRPEGMNTTLASLGHYHTSLGTELTTGNPNATCLKQNSDLPSILKLNTCSHHCERHCHSPRDLH